MTNGISPQEIAQIKLALTNSLSTENAARDQAQKFLMQECEPNPAFQFALLKVIQAPEGDSTLQYQAILCMKNSLTRLLQQHRTRSRRIVGVQATAGKTVSFQGQPASQAVTISDEMRAQLKDTLLMLIQDPDPVILTKNSYDQLALVVAIFIKYDFPA
jgi:hypothetical protein